MNRRDRQRQQEAATACFTNSPTATYNSKCSASINNQHADYTNSDSSKCSHLKKLPKNKTLLKVWSPSGIPTVDTQILTTVESAAVVSNDEGSSNKPLDEFTLFARTFEASFADGSKAYFRRDCFHRLLTVSTGSSVVIDDAPCSSLSNSVASPAVASSLSAAFTSCNGNTGLAWLSPEARIYYTRALEVLSHCEKLESTLYQIVTQNQHLKAPFFIGRTQQRQQTQQNCSLNVTAISPYSSQSEMHPFHAYLCPFCSCYSKKQRSMFPPSSKLGSIFTDPNAMIVDAGSNKDYSSSGIASKSVSPPNFAAPKDGRLRVGKAELLERKLSYEDSTKGGSDFDDDRRQSCSSFNHRTSGGVFVDKQRQAPPVATEHDCSDKVMAGNSNQVLTANNQHNSCRCQSAKAPRSFKCGKANTDKASEGSTHHAKKTSRLVVESMATTVKQLPTKIGSSCKAAACANCLSEAMKKVKVSALAAVDSESSRRTRTSISTSTRVQSVKAQGKINHKQPIGSISEANESSFCRQMTTRLRRHNHGSKRKVTSQMCRQLASRQSEQLSISIRSARKLPEQKYDNCTPVTRCRDVKNKKQTAPMRLDTSENIIDDEEPNGKIVEIIFGESDEPFLLSGDG